VARFANQASRRGRIVVGVDRLDRHDPVEDRMAGAVDLAHSSRGNEIDDLVDAEPGAGLEARRHCVVAGKQCRRWNLAEAARCVVAREQRPNFCAKLIVSGARLRDECIAVCARTLDRVEEDGLDARPSVRRDGLWHCPRYGRARVPARQREAGER
jgi:hypothetical protein